MRNGGAHVEQMEQSGSATPSSTSLRRPGVSGSFGHGTVGVRLEGSSGGRVFVVVHILCVVHSWLVMGVFLRWDLLQAFLPRLLRV